MTRTRIVAILFLLFEIAAFVLVGKFLYHKEIIQLNEKTARNILIDKEKDALGRTIVTFNTACCICHEYHSYHKVRLTEEELEEFKNTGNIPIVWWDNHPKIWIILYWLAVMFGVLLGGGAFCAGMAECNKENICDYRDCPLRFRCAIYDSVEELDLQPFYHKMNKFFGY